MKKLVFVTVICAFTLLVKSSLAFAETTSAKKADNAVEITAITATINQYVKSINLLDMDLALKIWKDTNEVFFVHPRGHEHGWEAIKENFYSKTMGDSFSERNLVIHDSTIKVYGNTAVVEFYWDFYAKFQSDGTSLHTQGRETQVLIKDNRRWKLVHVHYSNMPLTGERQGF